MSINAFQGFLGNGGDQEEERLERDAAGLFGDDDDDDGENENGRRGQYGDDDDEDVDDILGLDDGGNGEAAGAEVDDESGLLMRFCPHDSSMLYPKVSCCGGDVFRFLSLRGRLRIVTNHRRDRGMSSCATSVMLRASLGATPLPFVSPTDDNNLN